MRDTRSTIFLCVVGVCALISLVAFLAVIPREGVYEREKQHNVDKVERFCGHKAAVVFDATYRAQDDTLSPAQDWIRRCTIGPDYTERGK